MLGLVNPEDTILQAEGDLQSFQKVQEVIVQLPIQKHIHKKILAHFLPCPAAPSISKSEKAIQPLSVFIVKIFHHTDEGILWSTVGPALAGLVLA